MKTWIKLETAYKPSQGPHVFRKVPFVTFEPANLKSMLCEKNIQLRYIFTPNRVRGIFNPYYCLDGCPLRFGLVLKGECINQKKLDVKTWPLSGANRTHQSCYPTWCRRSRTRRHSQGVKCGIFSQLLYTSVKIDKI